MIRCLSERMWILETKRSAYVLGLNGDGWLLHCYWGARLPRLEDYPAPAETPGWASFNGPGQILPEEYPAYGGTKYVEPCLKATFASGVRDCVWRFVEAQQAGDEELLLIVEDTLYPLRVALHYRVHTKYDLIERWAEIENGGAQAVTLEQVYSAQWHLPAGGAYRLTHVSGRWLDEMHLHREALAPGKKVLESRRLTSSHHANPWFAVDDGEAGETWGRVWFGALAWSGNWKLVAETTDFLTTRLSLGINEWDCRIQLAGGERFVTPACLGGYSAGGFGAASRALHDYIRDDLLPHGKTLHKVLYNSWEATLFDVDEESQVRLAELAADMGVELFVLDDGWFHRRNSDAAGLGDWWPDEIKFPRGLGGLVRRVNELGMDFGLWIEPEMVNPDSDLYRAHPDWVLHFPGRERNLMRNQLILNLARPDVQAYLIECIDRLLSENNIAFIKWDMNRNASEAGWPEAGNDAPAVWVRYVQGLYHVWETLRRRHPQVIWQSCSGGGGRADLGMLRLADQIWVSDNTEATARLRIQDGFSRIFPANVMEAWVTDAGRERVPLAFRFHVAMCGSLGVGGNLLQWSDAERQLAAACIAAYKEIRPLVQWGDQYRLQAGSFSAVQYVSKDRSEAALFVFRTWLPEPAQLPPLYLRGLAPEALYQVDGVAQPRSGAAWMQAGLHIELGNLDSTLRRIRRVD